MRARQIKPGLLKNELLGSADPHITILFAGLWMMADREGRLEDRPLRICAEVFPYRRRVTKKRVDEWLTWLRDSSLIARYVVENRRYIQVLAFLKHQNPHKDERPSQIPALTSDSHSTSIVQTTRPPPCDIDGSTRVVGLTPDSLSPDSLTAESSLREKREREETSRETGRSRLTDRLRPIYPPGMHAEANWILAERAIGKLLDAGERAEDLERLTRAYRAQQDAKGSTGTQFVKSPEKFFGPDGHWRGPFPIPLTKAETITDTNAAAAAEAKRRLFPEHA